MKPGLSLDNPHDSALRPSRLPGAAQWVGIAIFAVAIAVSAGYALAEHWRRATVMLGAAMLWLSVLRLVCDSRRLGFLAVRSRRFDVVFTALLGGAMVFLAASVDSLGS